jgi:uncharacterized protein (TIGR02444 family)
VIGFWDWALVAYAKPGVAEACLELQDQYQQCTAYLFWAAWASDQGIALDPPILSAGQTLARTWEAEVLQPLRQVRRFLKPAMPNLPDAPRETLREQVKANELAAEQILMTRLAELSTSLPGPAKDPALEAMAKAGALWTPSPPIEALAKLAERL